MKAKLTSAAIMALTLALLLAIVPAMAYFNSVPFNGQGLAANGSDSGSLQTEICGVPNGAEGTGPYMLWTLSAPGARNAEISGPWGSAIMNRKGNGIFTYVSGWYAPQDLQAHAVKAAYDGRPQAAVLLVSQGCDHSR